MWASKKGHTGEISFSYVIFGPSEKKSVMHTCIYIYIYIYISISSTHLDIAISMYVDLLDILYHFFAYERDVHGAQRSVAQVLMNTHAQARVSAAHSFLSSRRRSMSWTVSVRTRCLPSRCACLLVVSHRSSCLLHWHACADEFCRRTDARRDAGRPRGCMKDEVTDSSVISCTLEGAIVDASAHIQTGTGER